MKVNRLLVLLAIVCFSFSMPSWASAQPTKIQWTSNFTEKVLYKSVVTSQDETLLATYDDSGADMIYQVFKINNTTKVKTPLGTLIGGDIILHEAAGHAFIIHLNTKVNEWKVYDEDLVEVYRNTFGSAELTVSLNYNYLIYDSSDKRIYFSFNTLKEVSVEDITVEDYKMTIDDGNTFVDTVAINNVALEHKVIIDFDSADSQGFKYTLFTNKATYYNQHYYFLLVAVDRETNQPEGHYLYKANGNGQIVDRLKVTAGMPSSMAIFLDNKLIVAAFEGPSATYKVVNLDTFTVEEEIYPSDSSVHVLKMNSPQKYALLQVINGVNHYRIFDYQHNYLYTISGVNTIFRFTNKYIMTRLDNGDRIINANTGKEVYESTVGYSYILQDYFTHFMKDSLTGQTIVTQFKAGDQTNFTPTTKSWEITFNQPVDSSTVNNNSIYVTDYLGNKVSDIHLQVQGEKVIVSPAASSYRSGFNYKIHIEKSVKSNAGSVLIEGAEKIFSVR